MYACVTEDAVVRVCKYWRRQKWMGNIYEWQHIYIEVDGRA